MKFNPALKQYLTESILKTSFKMPSRLNIPPTAVRFALEQLTRVFPQHKDVKIRSLRLAGIPAEEIKPQKSATQLIFHIHGGAFFVGSLKTHRHTTPENLKMTESIVNRSNILYKYAPQYHNYRKPTINWMTTYELYIRWCK